MTAPAPALPIASTPPSGVASGMRMVAATTLDARAPAIEFAPDSVLDGRYRLERVIGCGGVCVVYEARHLFTGLPAAIKTLLPQCRFSPDARERLLREARLLGALRHPNIVSVVDAALTAEGFPYLVLEKLEGRPLDGLIAARQRLGIAESVQIVERVARAIALAHERGVVHRDLKPGNVVVVRGPSPSEGDQVRLIDFGIAAESHSEFGAPKLTRQGFVVGTLDYFAPEQVDGAPASASTDVYALGVILYECLTGEVPFQGSEARLVRLTTDDAPDVRRARSEVDAALAQIVAKALARDPAARFASASDLADALRAQGAPASLSLLRGVAPPLPRKTREHARAPYATPLRASLGGRSIEGRTEDLSVGGVLVTLSEHVEIGSRVDVVFATPMEARVVKLAALVRWVRHRERGGRFPVAAGLEFLNVPDDTRAEVQRYVDGG